MSGERGRSAISHALLVVIPAIAPDSEPVPSSGEDDVINLGYEAFIGQLSRAEERS